MRPPDSMTVHPAPELLALYSNRDVPLLTGWRLKSHISRCAECEHQFLLFRSATAELKREAAAETLTAFEAVADWSRIEREMLGNIGVGVAAARCIQKVGHKKTWLMRAAIAAGMTAVFAGGWATHIPGNEGRRLLSSLRGIVSREHVPSPESVVQTTSEGIAVRSQGVTLTILHPRTAVVSLSGNSSLEARYVDENTGQLTITNVYGQ